MIALLISSFFLSCLLTYFVKKIALWKNVLDIPNQRSSHSIPTPRGGGLAFVVMMLLLFPFLFLKQQISYSLFLTCFIPGLLISALGFYDDVVQLSAKSRLIAHFLISIIIIYTLHGMPLFPFFNWTFSQTFANILGVIFLVWLINLYNFMDGVDGIASVEALSVCISGALIFWLTNHQEFVVIPLLLSAAVGGFLVWNFPPARIFMGDAGSGFLGMTTGILMLQAGKIEAKLFWVWFILLGVFIVDATITLLSRALRNEKVYKAHRSHAYQHAALMYKSHLSVTIGVLVINVFWLLPIALMVGLGNIRGEIGCLLAYAPLILLAIRFNAGNPDFFRAIEQK